MFLLSLAKISPTEEHCNEKARKEPYGGVQGEGRARCIRAGPVLEKPKGGHREVIWRGLLDQRAMGRWCIGTEAVGEVRSERMVLEIARVNHEIVHQHRKGLKFARA
jgi:hypothetical protein